MAWKNLTDNNGQAALYMLLGQTEWILRRTETVSFLNGGSTRRSISFDCVLPDDETKWLQWVPGAALQHSPADPQYVGLPVTFLGKSDLINLDVKDGNGAALHTVGMNDDATVLETSLEGCFKSLGILGDFLQYQLSLLGLDELKRVLGPTADEAERNDNNNFKAHFRAAMGSVISCCEKYRNQQPDSASTSDATSDFINNAIAFFNKISMTADQRQQDSDHNLGINNLGFTENQAASAIIYSEWHGIASADTNCEQRRDLNYFTVHSLGFLWSEGPDRTPASAPNIKDARELDDKRKDAISRIMRKDGEKTLPYQSNTPQPPTRVQFWDEQRQAPLSDGFDQTLDNESDWAVRALLRFLDIWQREPKDQTEYNAMQSYLLLLSSACDTYPLIVLVPIELATKQQRMMVKISFDAGYREDELRKYIPFNQIIDLSFQTYGANSTHIEVAPAENVVLTNVTEVDIPNKSQASDKSDTHKGSRSPNTICGLRNMRKSKNLSDHLSARVAADRLHVSIRKHSSWPLTHLRLTVMMRRNYTASFLLWSLLLLILDIGMMCVIGMPGWQGLAMKPAISSQILSFFSAQNILAILALVYTLWVARRIGTMQHRVVEGLNSSLTGLLNTDLLIFTVLSLIASSGMKTGDNGGDDIVSGNWSSWCQISCFVGVIIATLIAGIAIHGFVLYWMRSTKYDGVFPLYVDCSMHPRKYEKTRRKRPAPILPADRAAFSALETCSERQRQRALTARGKFLRSLNQQH